MSDACLVKPHTCFGVQHRGLWCLRQHGYGKWHVTCHFQRLQLLLHTARHWQCLGLGMLLRKGSGVRQCCCVLLLLLLADIAGDAASAAILTPYKGQVRRCACSLYRNR